MIITSTSLVPIGWRVSNIEAIVPMAMVAGSHLLYPSESWSTIAHTIGLLSDASPFTCSRPQPLACTLLLLMVVKRIPNAMREHVVSLYLSQASLRFPAIIRHLHALHIAT
jgi:hypothetical protein